MTQHADSIEQLTHISLNTELCSCLFKYDSEFMTDDEIQCISYGDSLRLITHETFVAGLLLCNFVAQQKLCVCHTLLQGLATSCAAKF